MKDQCSVDIQAEQRAAEQEAAAARKVAAQEAEAARKAQQVAAYQAAQERAATAAAASALQLRKSQTIPAVHATVDGFECSSLLSLFDHSCTDKATFVYMQLEVTNESKEALSGVLIGLAVAPANGNCPSSYAQTHTLQIPLSSGETRVTKIPSDLEFVKHPVCIKVLDVQFAG
jgi:hypothetical protein